MYNFDKHKLYRPESNRKPTPGKYVALESYNDTIKIDIEKF